MQKKKTLTVKYICALLGRREVYEAVGVSKAAVSNAEREGKFPAAWYRVITEMCGLHGIECPDSLFTFIPPSASKAEDRVAS